MESVAFVAVPFPAQGHLNQLMHLSLLVASRGLSVHYAAPAAHVRQAQSRVHGWDAKALASIHFHHLDVPTYDSPAPDPAAASPFPSHLMLMWESFTDAARAPLAVLLDRLSATHRRVVVVHDKLSAFAAVEAARLSNGEAFGLQCAAISYSLTRLLDREHKLLRDHDLQPLAIDACTTKEFMEYISRAAGGTGGVPSSGLVMNTCRALEGEFIDAIAEHPRFKDEKLFAVGPLNPLLDASARTPAGKTRHQCMDWLDAQPPASVLYVSFGTTTSFRAEQIAEMAVAIKGMQQAELEILAHGATAAFMSHCGWNSTMESLSHGKPILAWPMHSDQPWDAEFLCKYLKVGLLVRPWEKHGEVVPAAAIQEVIEEAMVSDNGMALRRRAKVLGEAVRA
ncbi:hypothetical protein ACQ4PT_042608 [Festuca glaucescens]